MPKALKQKQEYGIPLSRYTVFLQNCPLGHDPKDLDFFICVRTVRKANCDTTSFECLHATSFRAKREHHCRPAAQMNDVALRANDVLRNDVGLRPMMLRFAQMDTPSRVIWREST